MKTAILIIACLFCAGCDILGATCTTEQRFNLIVEVRDQQTGEPAAPGVTGTARHDDGVITELSSVDSLILGGDWDRERAGRSWIELRKPGYLHATATTEVDENRCHVETRTVRMNITPDPAAVAITPTAVQLGDHINTSPSAGVQLSGNSLHIVGAAPAPCSELRVISFRAHDELHIQLEPQEPEDNACQGPWNQQFALQYDLPAGITYLLVTAARGIPAVLFSGTVNPG
jgi:hypothetical protein